MLGPARKILGMEVVWDRKIGTLFLSQKSYLNKVLNRFEMNGSKPITNPMDQHFTTPMDQHFKLSSYQSLTSDAEKDYMSYVLYASGVR